MASPARSNAPIGPTDAPSFCVGAARCIDAARLELVRLYHAASPAERSDGWEQIRRSLCELERQCADLQLDHGQRGSNAASSVGLADESVAPTSPRSFAEVANNALDSGAASLGGAVAESVIVARSSPAALGHTDGIPSSMMIELKAHHGARMFDVQNDLARVFCGRSAAALAMRLRILSVAVGVLGGAVPTLVIFAVHWTNGGLGQFSLAYEWPRWLEVWMCVGWTLTLCAELLSIASMQREIAWMALKQFSTLWIVAMTGIWVTALVSLYEFGVHRSTWVDVPAYVTCALFYPLIAMADALPPKLRLAFLRFFGPFALGALATVALVLRLPMAADTPGELVWTVMGTDTVTNLQALAYSSTVMTVLLAKGILRAWMFPNKLAFIQTSLSVTECVAGAAAAAEGPHARNPVAPAASASVAPHPLNQSSLE
jgi:hypothetical protein